jgi:hypothetical protein
LQPAPTLYIVIIAAADDEKGFDNKTLGREPGGLERERV